MGENSKQVRVDNWGIFFLQRLQSFFNKTDYCDLTLQFNGNVQLKVHRLVLNACTEYFQVLEQTCEMIDDNIIIMPQDLQSDVVLPIVNFMYTGMLEFQMGNYEKLYKTAELMNITVLTKLLDAQKVPPSPLHKPMNKKQPPPVTWNLQGKKIMAKTMDPDLPEPLPGRKLPIWKRKSVPYTSELPRITKIIPPDPLMLPKIFAPVDNTPKPTRFELPEEADDNTFDSSSFDEISYTSKPLAMPARTENRKIDSFEEIKRTAKTLKRTMPSQSPQKPTRPLDLEEVKDFLREQKLRSELIDYDDSEAADGDLYASDSSSQTSQKNKSPVHTKRVRFSLDEKENSSMPPKISISTTGSTSSDVNHTKIITEVLKKYPHLVKKNKNIRLKILAKSTTSPTTKVMTPVKVTTSTSKVNLTVTKQDQGKQKIRIGNTEQLGKKVEEGPWICAPCSLAGEPVEFVLYYLYRKHMTEVHNEKVDSRMCKFCGHKSTKHNLLMYHQYVAHGVKPPLMYNFPKCGHCNYVALTEALLIKHKLSHKNFFVAQCFECKLAFNSQDALAVHLHVTGHTENPLRPNYDCQYCAKKYQTGANLFTHIKLHHKKSATRDGIASLDEDRNNDDDDDEQYEIQQDQSPPKEKINILSNVKVSTSELTGNFLKDNPNQKFVLPEMTGTELTNLEPSSEAEALSNVASGIATSLGLVDTIVVLDDNQQYILRSDQHDNTEFILPELTHLNSSTEAYIQNLPSGGGGGGGADDGRAGHQNKELAQSILSNNSISSTDELVMVLTDHDYGDGTNNEMLNSDNSNIVVLYSHPVDGQETTQFITQQGNLILNPDTGMIEVAANFNQTGVSNAGADNAGECLPAQDHADIDLQQQHQQHHHHQHQQDQKPICEESIEMIQQEIKNMDQDATNNKGDQTEEALVHEQTNADNMEAAKQEDAEYTTVDGGEVLGEQGMKSSEIPVQFVEEPMEVDDECTGVIEEEQSQKEPTAPLETAEPKAEASPAEVVEEESPGVHVTSDETSQEQVPVPAPLQESELLLVKEENVAEMIDEQQENNGTTDNAQETTEDTTRSEDVPQDVHVLQEVEPMEVDSGVCDGGQDAVDDDDVEKLNVCCDNQVVESIDEVDAHNDVQTTQHQESEQQPEEEVEEDTRTEEEEVEEEEDTDNAVESAASLCQDSQDAEVNGGGDLDGAASTSETPTGNAHEHHLDDTSLSQDVSEENETSAPESASQESVTESTQNRQRAAAVAPPPPPPSVPICTEPKISNMILEDWEEDTDNSQQSDRETDNANDNDATPAAPPPVKETKPAVSINTLINDWEEDEDEIDEKHDKSDG